MVTKTQWQKTNFLNSLKLIMFLMTNGILKFYAFRKSKEHEVYDESYYRYLIEVAASIV